MASDVLAEALVRIEHKVDILVRGTEVMFKALKIPAMLYKPLHFTGESCPVCQMPIDYQIDVLKKVVFRKCGCKTGKIPPAMDLVTIAQPGGSDANPRVRKEDRNTEDG